MRIAIVNLTGGSFSEGYKKYLKNILPFLSVNDDVEAILCASPGSQSVHSWFNAMNNVTFVTCKRYGIMGRTDTALHNHLDAFRPDVIFVPAARYLRYGLTTPVVCMLHNMLPMAELKHISLRETLRNKVNNGVARAAVMKSSRVIAVSNFVSEFMQSKWNISSSKIGVVYHGVEARNRDYAIMPSAIPIEWAGNFLFSPGAIESYKGLEDILFALRYLRKEGKQINTVFAGAARSAMMPYYRKLQTLAKLMNLEENIRWVGMLNEREMAWCYKNAHAFVTSSRVEACPNTALEAMSYGNIIISSKALPMQEIFGELAFYYETGDTKKLVECIINSFQLTASKKNKLSEAALNRGLSFSWEKAARQTLDELQKTS